MTPHVSHETIGFALIAWLIVMSMVTFAAYGWDKRLARRHGRRVPERTLHALALFGGWPGGGAGRAVFRHKTLHPSFTVVLALSTLLWAGIAVWWLLRSHGL